MAVHSGHKHGTCITHSASSFFSEPAGWIFRLTPSPTTFTSSYASSWLVEQQGWPVLLGQRDGSLFQEQQHRRKQQLFLGPGHPTYLKSISLAPNIQPFQSNNIERRHSRGNNSHHGKEDSILNNLKESKIGIWENVSAQT